MADMPVLENRIPISQWVDTALQIDEPMWLIDELIPAQGLTLITGRPKMSKKSSVAMLCSMAMGSGKPISEIRPTGITKNLYLQFEGPPKAAAMQYKALERGAGLRLENCVGSYMSHGERFFLDDTRSIKELAAWVVHNDVRCVFIDTLARSFLGDENSSRDIGAAMRGIEKLRDLRCAVVLVHHLRKSDRGPMRLEEFLDPDMGMRGSSALCGAYDQIISVKAVLNSETCAYDTYYIIGGKHKEYIGREANWSITYATDRDGEKVSTMKLNLGPEEDLQDVSNRAINPAQTMVFP